MGAQQQVGSVQGSLAETERLALAALEIQTREQARQAALNCASALLAYIRANPRLLFADTLPAREAEELRGCLTEYATTLRVMQTPPERVIVAVKELVREAAIEMRVETRSLTEAAVQWAIAAYFPPQTKANSRS